MAIPLKQSTASQEVPLGPFVDATDGVTQETGLTISNTDIKIWKTGATTLADKNSGGATHISNGIYYAVLDATDTDTLGPLVIFVQESGALPVRLECVVLPAVVYDSGIAGSDTLTVDVTQWNGTAVATPTTAGVPEVDVTHWLGTAAATPTTAGVPEVDVTFAAGTAWGSGAITAASIASDAITAAKIADGAIDAATFAADAITAAKIAADVGTEIAAAVLSAAAAAPIDANVQEVNDVALTGDGSATPWGPA